MFVHIILLFILVPCMVLITSCLPLFVFLFSFTKSFSSFLKTSWCASPLAYATSSENNPKWLPRSNSTNRWTNVSLKPCCRYHQIIAVCKMIFFAFITPSNFCLPLTVFLSVFSLYIFIGSDILQCGISGTSKSGAFHYFYQKLVRYLNINLC